MFYECHSVCLGTVQGRQWNYRLYDYWYTCACIPHNNRKWDVWRGGSWMDMCWCEDASAVNNLDWETENGEHLPPTCKAPTPLGADGARLCPEDTVHDERQTFSRAGNTQHVRIALARPSVIYCWTREKRDLNCWTQVSRRSHTAERMFHGAVTHKHLKL